MHMRFFFARISVNVWVFFMGVIRQIVDVVQSCSPDANHANIGRNFVGKFSHLAFDLKLFIACFLLINYGVNAARIDQLADELFWFVVSHEQSAADAPEISSELLHCLCQEFRSPYSHLTDVVL